MQPGGVGPNPLPRGQTVGERINELARLQTELSQYVRAVRARNPEAADRATARRRRILAQLNRLRDLDPNALHDPDDDETSIEPDFDSNESQSDD